MVVCFLSSVTELVQISRIIAENDPQCSRRSTDDIMRINFQLRFWSRGLRVVVLQFLYQMLCKYLHPVRRYKLLRNSINRNIAWYTSPYPWSCSVGWCLAEELGNGDQRRRTGSGSALEACLRRCVIEMCVYFTFIYIFTFICSEPFCLQDARHQSRLHHVQSSINVYKRVNVYTR